MKNKFKKGVKYIRICGCSRGENEDWSYTDEPLIYLGKEKGELLFKDFELEITVHLDKDWNDGNWIPFDETREQERTSLSDLSGKMVTRVHPADLGDIKDGSYMGERVKLLAATKYHVIMQSNFDLGGWILDARYANPEDWECVE